MKSRKNSSLSSRHEREISVSWHQDVSRKPAPESNERIQKLTPIKTVRHHGREISLFWNRDVFRKSAPECDGQNQKLAPAKPARQHGRENLRSWSKDQSAETRGKRNWDVKGGVGGKNGQ